MISFFLFKQHITSTSQCQGKSVASVTYVSDHDFNALTKPPRSRRADMGFIQYIPMYEVTKCIYIYKNMKWDNRGKLVPI